MLRARLYRAGPDVIKTDPENDHDRNQICHKKSNCIFLFIRYYRTIFYKTTEM